MSTHMRWRLGALAVVILVLASALLVPATSRLCGAALTTDKEPGMRPFNNTALACTEFWFNRYQTLLAALVAAAAAGAAWIAVQKQIEVSNKQIAISLGNIDPDFFAYSGTVGQNHNYPTVIVEITNNNRFDINVDVLRVEVPTGFEIGSMEYLIDDNQRKLIFFKFGNTYAFDLRVPGVRPSAPEARGVKLLIKSTPVANPLACPEILHHGPFRGEFTYALRKQNPERKAVRIECGIVFRTFGEGHIVQREVPDI